MQSRVNVLTRRTFLGQSSGAALHLAGQVTPLRPSQRPPNFVLVLADDLGWRDLGCYGSTFYETPHIDRLAASGMRFSDAYAACPVCSPTRASLLTGKYPARVGITFVIPDAHHRRLWEQTKLSPPAIVQHLPLNEVTIAEALKVKGYKTASIGKWHLGPKGYYPEDQGFDVNIGGCQFGAVSSHFYPGWEKTLREGPKGKPGDYLADRLTDCALQFIDDTKENPFFLYLPHYLVHTPLEAKKEYIARYELKDTSAGPQSNAVYAGMVQSLDDSVGRILRKIDESGIADRTVVIFTSDNGGLSTVGQECDVATSNYPLRDGKGHLYEGGIRVPLIVRWPGVTQPGSLCREQVTSPDFYPTMTNIAGIPSGHGNPVDGVDFRPVLSQTRTLDRQAICWHFPHYSPQGGKPAGAIRLGDLKLIEFYEDGRVELYDLAEDIGERNNLAAKMPEKATELQAKLAAWRKQVGARMPARNPNYKPAEEPALFAPSNCRT